MRMNVKMLKQLFLLNLPYLVVGLMSTNIGEGIRLSKGEHLSQRLLSFMIVFPRIFQNPLPSIHPMDLLIGLLCAIALRLAVYLKGKSAKRYRHNREYGSARWGSAQDIEPFMDKQLENNIILTKTEGLTMDTRPKNPANARNKNILVVGGSGSGKTRFVLKPNLL